MSNYFFNTIPLDQDLERHKKERERLELLIANGKSPAFVKTYKDRLASLDKSCSNVMEQISKRKK